MRAGFIWAIVVISTAFFGCNPQRLYYYGADQGFDGVDAALGDLADHLTSTDASMDSILVDMPPAFCWPCSVTKESAFLPEYVHGLYSVVDLVLFKGIEPGVYTFYVKPFAKGDRPVQTAYLRKNDENAASADFVWHKTVGAELNYTFVFKNYLAITVTNHLQGTQNLFNIPSMFDGVETMEVVCSECP